MNLESHLIKQEKFTLKPEFNCGDSVKELINNIKLFINNVDCTELTIDLSGFNMIYATQIGILASTHHFIKYINGNITIIVDDEAIEQNLIKLKLTNAKIILSSKELEFCNIA